MGLPQGVLVKKDHGTTQRDRPSHQLFGKSSFTNNAESLFLQVEVESILYIHIA